MKTMKIIYKIIILMTILPFALTAQDNTFNGTVDNNWDNQSNWSTGKVPPSTIVQKITIAADCEVPASNSTDYTFMEGSIFQINSGITFTNNGTGTWTMNGTFDKEGTYVGDLTINGSIEPGDNSSSWTCGDNLIYGGQSYSTVQIGSQCWMAENLNIGEMINSNSSSDDQNDNNIIEKYCYGNNSTNCDTYGGLYQWNEMMQYTIQESTQGICPTGWHIPSDNEWKTLEMELGMSQTDADNTGWRGTNEGSKMAGNAGLWHDGALKNDSEFGSSGLDFIPGGYRSSNGNFYGINDKTYLWSSSQDDTYNSYYRNIKYDITSTYRNRTSPSGGFSVRCVKD